MNEGCSPLIEGDMESKKRFDRISDRVTVTHKRYLAYGCKYSSEISIPALCWKQKVCKNITMEDVEKQSRDGSGFELLNFFGPPPVPQHPDRPME